MGKTIRVMETRRFIPTKRTALDGRTWWVVFDRVKNRYSTLTCFGRYPTKRICLMAIYGYMIHYANPNTI